MHQWWRVTLGRHRKRWRIQTFEDRKRKIEAVNMASKLTLILSNWMEKSYLLLMKLLPSFFPLRWANHRSVNKKLKRLLYASACINNKQYNLGILHSYQFSKSSICFYSTNREINYIFFYSIFSTKISTITSQKKMSNLLFGFHITKDSAHFTLNPDPVKLAEFWICCKIDTL